MILRITRKVGGCCGGGGGVGGGGWPGDKFVFVDKWYFNISSLEEFAENHVGSQSSDR